MSEEENKGVEAEASEAVAQPDESNDAQNEAQETPEQRRQRNDAEYNWAEMRRHMREKEREIAELKDQFSSIKQKQLPPDEEDYGFKDDDLIEGKHLKSLKSEIKQLRQELKQKEVSTIDERLQIKYPDFMSTVTKENIELLKETKPQLAKSLLKFADDPYQQSELAYEYIKTFVPQRDESMNKDKKKALENAKKPISVQSVGKTSAIGQVHQFENGLTPELKSQLYKEMQQIRKGA